MFARRKALFVSFALFAVLAVGHVCAQNEVQNHGKPPYYSPAPPTDYQAKPYGGYPAQSPGINYNSYGAPKGNYQPGGTYPNQSPYPNALHRNTSGFYADEGKPAYSQPASYPAAPAYAPAYAPAPAQYAAPQPPQPAYAPSYNQPPYSSYYKPAAPVYNQPPVNYGPQPYAAYAPPKYANQTNYNPSYVGLDNYPYGAPKPYYKCGIPNAPRGLYIDPAKIAGVWYGYNVWYINATQDKLSQNVINYYTNLGKCYFPTTEIPCAVMTQEQYYIDRDNGTCQNLQEVCHFTVDGRQIGPYFDSGSITFPAGIDNSIVLAMDYGAYAFYHSCNKYGYDGICADPFLYTYTRRKPEDMGANEKRKIDEALANAVKPFCFDPRQFVYYAPWNNTLPACRRTPGSDCYQTMKAAYESTIQDMTA
ncbi:uncharacterized protein LOC129601982 [Paramacrobiotus metropolitanus]|uniref:uncharacterized protein LOC129601982 n=1 Tax=Paramacrobiotus metropolitanus TaxID=2943436 RepID=UPI0024465368|nr:uncharacterized protein LOC129601982 [Paramacrobiotus metropolitanus]